MRANRIVAVLVIATVAFMSFGACASAPESRAFETDPWRNAIPLFQVDQSGYRIPRRNVLKYASIKQIWPFPTGTIEGSTRVLPESDYTGGSNLGDPDITQAAIEQQRYFPSSMFYPAYPGGGALYEEDTNKESIPVRLVANWRDTQAVVAETQHPCVVSLRVVRRVFDAAIPSDLVVWYECHMFGAGEYRGPQLPQSCLALAVLENSNEVVAAYEYGKDIPVPQKLKLAEGWSTPNATDPTVKTVVAQVKARITHEGNQYVPLPDHPVWDPAFVRMDWDLVREEVMTLARETYSRLAGGTKSDEPSPTSPVAHSSKAGREFQQGVAAQD